MRQSALITALLFAATGLAAVPADAQLISIPFGGPKKVKPSPNRDLLGSPAAIAAAVVGPGRPAAMVRLDAVRQPAAVLQNLDLRLGGRVLVVEADPGYYAEIIGAAVEPGGRVTLALPPGTMADAAKRKVLIDLVGRVPNVTLLTTSPPVRFAVAAFDFVLLHRSPAVGDATLFARTLFAAVRPGGSVGVVGGGGDGGGVGDGGTPDRVAGLVRAGFFVDTQSRIVPQPADDAGVAGDVPDRVVVRLVKPE